MDEKTNQLWRDTFEGMENRACFFHNDNDLDGRNRSWYAKKVYGDKYQKLRNKYQQNKIDEIE